MAEDRKIDEKELNLKCRFWACIINCKAKKLKLNRQTAVSISCIYNSTHKIMYNSPIR